MTCQAQAITKHITNANTNKTKILGRGTSMDTVHYYCYCLIIM